MTATFRVGTGTTIPSGSKIRFILGRIGGLGFVTLSCGAAADTMAAQGNPPTSHAQPVLSFTQSSAP